MSTLPSSLPVPKRLSAGATGGALIALIWLVYGVATVGQHGLTLDDTSFFYAGDRTLFFLTHPTVKGALDFPSPGEPPGLVSRFPRWPDFSDPMNYPVFQHLVMAVSNWLFHVQLGWVNDIDGHHLGIVFLHAVGIFLYTFYASRLFGPLGGISAGIIYALTPSIVGFAFNNPKDLIETDFYGATVLAAASAFLNGRPRDLWGAGVLAGLALSCKINGAFAAITLLLWLPLVHRRFREFVAQGLLKPLLFAPLVAFGIFFVLWPWLWYGTPLDWVHHLAGYVTHILAFAKSERPSFTAFPLVVLASTTPPLDLLLLVLGGVSIFTLGGPLRPVRWLLVIWLGLPLLRVAVPHSEFYDGNRHFMEYITALAAIAGVGAASVLDILAGLPRGRAVAVLAATAGLYCLWLPIADYRPFEGAYFNDLVGGLGGAQRNALFYMQAPPHDSRESGSEGDFWASGLHEALELVERIAPPGATLGTCGPSPINVTATLTFQPHFRVTSWMDPRADYIYFMPRECYCKQSDIQRMETERPVITRRERGGGLIYEILGPRVPYALPSVSPHTRYEDLPHYPH